MVDGKWVGSRQMLGSKWVWSPSPYRIRACGLHDHKLRCEGIQERVPSTKAGSTVGPGEWRPVSFLSQGPAKCSPNYVSEVGRFPNQYSVQLVPCSQPVRIYPSGQRGTMRKTWGAELRIPPQILTRTVLYDRNLTLLCHIPGCLGLIVTMMSTR